MPNKYTYREICKELSRCNIPLDILQRLPNVDIYFKTHNWDGGYESGHGYDGAREEFYNDQRKMFSYLQDFFCKLDGKICIICPLAYNHYFETWSNLKENDIYKELIQILNHFGIRKESKSGLVLNTNEDFTIIKRFVEGGFRYISRAVMFFPESGIIIEPYHHMNLLFYCVRHNNMFDLLSALASIYLDIGLNL